MDLKGLLKFQTQRKLIGVSKNFLKILEDLQAENYNIPEEKFARLRKRILDDSGESYRELEAIIDKLTITM